MALIYPVQTNFTGGEISPLLRKRIDLAKYSSSLKTMKNFMALPYGAAANRPGTYFTVESKISSKQSRLIPFRHSTEQAYVIEAGENYFRYCKDGAQIVKTLADTAAWSGATTYAVADFVKYDNVIYRSLQSANTNHQPDVSPTWWVANDVYEIYSPFVENELFDITYTQSADVMYFCHGDKSPKKLSRTGHVNWTLEEFLFKNGPLLKENDTDDTLMINGTVGVDLDEGASVTLTSSADLFQNGHVGAHFGFRYVSANKAYSFVFSGTGAWTSNSYTVSKKWKLTIKPDATDEIGSAAHYIEKSIDEGITWYTIKVIPPTESHADIEISGEEKEKCLIRFRRDATGGDSDKSRLTFEVIGFEQWSFVKITGVTDARNANGELETDFYRAGVALKTWAEGAWSDVRGYPSAWPCFYQDRLGMACTKTESQTFYMSKTSDYDNLGVTIPTADDDAIKGTIASQDVNKIQAIVPLNDSIVLTSGSEFKMAPSTSSEALTPTSIQVRPQEYWGASKVRPLILGNIVMYVQEKGNHVRAIGWQYEFEGYTSNDVSILARHLFKGYNIVEWAYQKMPDFIIWGVRDDGKLLGFTFMREQQVFAWHIHETDGEVESVCVIPGLNQDDVYLLVKRTINGTDKRYIERMVERTFDAISGAFFVDCGLTYSGAPATTFSNLGHLEGKTVAVLADGVATTKKVAGGQITLSTAASKVHIGLPYTCDLETLSFEMQLKDGTTLGRKKKIGRAILELYESYGGKMGESSTGKLQAIRYPANVPYLYTGDVEETMSTTYRRNAHVFIRQDQPYPMTVLAIAPEVDVEGR